MYTSPDTSISTFTPRMKLGIPHTFLDIKGSIQRMDIKIVWGNIWDTSVILTILFWHICHLVEAMATSKKVCLFWGHFDYFLSLFYILGMVYDVYGHVGISKDF